MKNNSHILLWNARGIAKKLTDFKNYVYKIKPLLICITETHLKSYHQPSIQDYIVATRRDREDGYGGLLILHHKTIAVRPHQLSTFVGGHMEATSLQYNYQTKWSTLILLYNPCKNIEVEEFCHYFDAVQEVGIICGDLNAHHLSWETNLTRNNFSGSSLFSTLNNYSNISLLNPPNFKTRIDPNTGKASNLDMFLVSSHYLDKDLSLGADKGSDHNAKIMEVQSICRPLLLFRPRWTIKIKNLPKWSKTVENAVIPENGSTLEIYKSLTDQLLKT